MAASATMPSRKTDAHSLPGPIRGGLSLVLYALKHAVLVHMVVHHAALKALVPLPGWRRGCSRVLNAIVEAGSGATT